MRAHTTTQRLDPVHQRGPYPCGVNIQYVDEPEFALYCRTRRVECAHPVGHCTMVVPCITQVRPVVSILQRVDAGIPDALEKLMQIPDVVCARWSLCAVPDMFVPQKACFEVGAAYQDTCVAETQVTPHPGQTSDPSGADRRSLHSRKNLDARWKVCMYEDVQTGKAEPRCTQMTKYYVVVQQRLDDARVVMWDTDWISLIVSTKRL